MNSRENLGNADRFIRIYAAIFFMISFIVGQIPGVIGLAMFAVAIYLLVAAVLSVCPLYNLIGIRTTRKHPRPR